MREINSYQQGQAAGAIAKLPGPVEWPEGQGCPRTRTEVVVEVKNGTAGPLDYTFARAKAAAACLFGFVTNWFGDKAKDIVDNALTFAQLRELIINLTDDDVIINDKFYGDYADADVIKAAVAAGAVFNLRIEVPRPFEITRLGKDRAIWVPGWTQMAMLHSEVKRLDAGAFDTNGNFVQNKAADFLMIGDTCTLHDDVWANVPRTYVNKEIGKLNHAPAGELALLGVYERTMTGVQTMADAANTIGLFSLKRAGEAPIHENVDAARVARDAMYDVLPGGEDLGKLALPLHVLPQALDPTDIPTGSGWLVEMPGAEIVGGAEIGYCHIPAFDGAYAETIVKPNLVGEEQGKEKRVKITTALVKQGRSITSKLAAFAPRAIVRESDPEYGATSGDVLDAKLGKIVQSVPPPVAEAAQKTAAAGSLGVAKAVAKSLVDGTTAVRGRAAPMLGRLVRGFNK
jgi:hypothetical protein